MTEVGSPLTTPGTQLIARGITKTFGEQRALDRVDLTVQAGEIHGLLGENGAGKSTLMNVLAGVVRPDTGTVTVEGRPLRFASPPDSAALGIGLVHQHFSLIPTLTVAENLSLAAGEGPAIFRRSRQLADRGLAVAERLGWHFNPDTPVWQLPVGHQQRLEILKTVQRDARWLLFDEPTAVLSPPEVQELFEVLERLRQEGRAVVFISHKLGEVLRLCDRVTVLRHGRRVGQVARGTTAEELARLMVGTGDCGLRIADCGLSVPESRNPQSAIRNPQVPALAVEHLRVRDDRGGQAVRGLSFAVQRGEIFGIAGVDGNGQAELAEAIVGLRPAAGVVRLAAGGSDGGDLAAQRPPPPTSGEGSPGSAATASPLPQHWGRGRGWGPQFARLIALRGRKLTPMGPRPGYIPQDRRLAGLVLPMSVRENLVLEIHTAPEFRWGPVMRLPRLWAAAHTMARRFDVRVADERQPAGTLSGGNQQKIVIARALTGDRSLLVAVNPTRGLDVGATAYVHEQLRAARAAGVGVLLISTELDEVLSLSDQVAVLYEGQFQGIVPPTESRDRIGQMLGGVPGGTGPEA